MSSFDKWFKEQFGPRPCQLHYEADLVEEASRGEQAKKRLEQAAIWDAEYRAALYAWQARDVVGGVEHE